MQTYSVISYICPSCEKVAVDRAPARGQLARCPHCQYRTRRPDAKPFGRREWNDTRDPRLLREAWCASGRDFTSRKVWLIACGVARVGFDWCRNARFLDAVAFGEAQADDRPHPGSREEIEAGLSGGYSYPSDDWERLGFDCVRCNFRDPALTALSAYPGVVLGVYRDLLPNPFTAVVWNPDWLTSTVVALAHTTYESRDFSVMPILADALQDAGCEDERILGHCRGPGPHARGCWVLDAILGKS